MTAAKRSAAMNFGRLRIRLPDQTGEFGRAAASGHYWLETVVVTGSPVAGWLSKSEAKAFVALAEALCQVDELRGTFVAEAVGVTFQSGVAAAGWSTELAGCFFDVLRSAGFSADAEGIWTSILTAAGSAAVEGSVCYRADISATMWVANPEDWQ